MSGLEEKNLAFMVQFMDLPAAELNKGLDKIFPQIQAMMGTIQGGTLKKESKLTLGKYPGREYEVEVAGQGASVLRVYIVDQRVYTLLAVGADPAAPANARQTY